MISSTNTAYNLTVANTASPSYSLKVMTVVAAIFFPIVLLYQGWTYRVFRRRLSVPARRRGPRSRARLAGTPPPDGRRAGGLGGLRAQPSGLECGTGTPHARDVARPAPLASPQ